MGEVQPHDRAPGRQEKQLAEDSSAAAKGNRAQWVVRREGQQYCFYTQIVGQ